jgi:hypothetical protein
MTSRSELEDLFIGACETHAVDDLRAAVAGGLDPRAPIRGKSAMQWLTEMYARSDRFPLCVRLLLERGARLDDPAVAPVLLDDAAAVTAAVKAVPALLRHTTTLVSAFTPLVGATLLHVAAEYGNQNAARALIDAGADVNARTPSAADGTGGHTPLFHTVNANGNRSAPIMHLLLERGARTDVVVAALVWGKGFEWETTFFDVTPISYAQLGTLPQMHRKEDDIVTNVKHLLAAAKRPVPPLANVPNRYLRPKPKD